MPRTPAIFGISMISQKSRRWLVVLCYAVSWTLVLLPFVLSSRTAQFILGFFAGWAIPLFVIFYKLAKDTVIPMQEDGKPISLGLLHNALPGESRPDERQVAVRNAAYYKAYRIVALCSLSMPILFLSLNTWNIALLAIYIVSIWTVIYTLPQAIILWTEPDIPEEAY